jgi:hypothetical protein
MRPTNEQLASRRRLSRLASKRGAPEPTEAQRRATRERRRRVIGQLAKVTR